MFFVNLFSGGGNKVKKIKNALLEKIKSKGYLSEEETMILLGKVREYEYFKNRCKKKRVVLALARIFIS